VNVDRQHKLVRRWHVSNAAQHDSQAVDHLLMKSNSGAGVWADAAYRFEAMEAKLRDRKLKSHIHRKGRKCPIFCVTALWSMLPERSKDDDYFQGITGRAFEGLRAA